MVKNLRGYFSRDPSHSYYISGAPQCGIEDKNMGKSLQEAKYDYLWIQFYNNACSANDLFKDPNTNPNGAGYFNFKDWPKYLRNGASKDAKLFVGISGARAAAAEFDYVASNNLPSLVDQSKNVPNFAGVMVYDAAAVSSHGTSTPGKNYVQVVKDTLNKA
jgi:chitinase